MEQIARKEEEEEEEKRGLKDVGKRAGDDKATKRTRLVTRARDPDLLKVAKGMEVEGDVVANDIGQGLPFRPACFDGAISISAIQVCSPLSLPTRFPS